MTVLKFAAVTCAFYVSAALLIEILLIVLAHLLGGVGFFGTRLGWAICFGMVWLISFLLAWHVVMRPIVSRIPQ